MKKFVVVVDMKKPFDAGYLRIALIGMMVKVISARELKMNRRKGKE